MSDLSRGKAGQYMRAETARSLVDYDQATIGRIRKRSDDALAKVCDLFLRVLAEALDRSESKTLRVVIDVPSDDGTTATITHTLKSDDLKRRWKIQVVDSASTPGVKADKLATQQAMIPVLMELARTADDETVPPVARAFARSMFDQLALLGDLPPGVRYAPLKASAPTPAPPPPAEPAPPEMPAAPSEMPPPMPPAASLDEASATTGAV
jgi:hypothetical protein